MKTNPLKAGIVTEKSVGIGTVTREMVRGRAAELAIVDGHLSSDATRSHFAAAKRELTGEPDVNPRDALLDSAPESDRWNLVAGSVGHKVAVAPGEDEDEDGRSDNERLVAGGIAEAGLEQSLQAIRAATKEAL